MWYFCWVILVLVRVTAGWLESFLWRRKCFLAKCKLVSVHTGCALNSLVTTFNVEIHTLKPVEKKLEFFFRNETLFLDTQVSLAPTHVSPFVGPSVRHTFLNCWSQKEPMMTYVVAVNCRSQKTAKLLGCIAPSWGSHCQLDDHH